MDKKIFTIIESAVNDLKSIEQAILNEKIKTYEVFGTNAPKLGDDYYPRRVDVYTDKDTFMKIAVKLQLQKGWW